MGNNQLDVVVIPGNTKISNIEKDTLSSEVRIYDIIAISLGMGDHPFSVYGLLPSLIRYLNGGQIASFTYSSCKLLHSYSHLTDADKVFLIGKCRTVARNILRHATPRQIHHLYNVADPYVCLLYGNLLYDRYLTYFIRNIKYRYIQVSK